MIKIMVDSASDCRDKELYDYFVPILLNIGDREFLDGVDLDNDTFYEILTSTKDFPRTSQPSLESFIKIFEEIKSSGDQLIYFALSSGLSGTYQGAEIAKSMVEYNGIYIVDTKNATHMIALLAKYAKKLIAEGLSAYDIAEKCEELKTKIRIFAGLDTLEYLRRGGRLSNASAVVGTLANIKPIVTVTAEGKVESVGKCLGVGKAVQYVADKVKSFEIDENFPICSLYTCGEQNILKLESKLKNDGYEIFERLQVGSTIGAHVGPEVYGVFFVEK